MYIDILYIYIHVYIYIYTYIFVYFTHSQVDLVSRVLVSFVYKHIQEGSPRSIPHIYIYIYVYVYIYIFIEKNTYRTYTYMKIYLFISLILQWTWFPAPWFVLTCFPYFPVVVRCPNSCWCHILFPKAQSM